MTETEQTQAERKNKITLILIFLACSFPLILSWILLNFTDFVNKENTVNRGALIEPIVPIENIDLIKHTEHEDEHYELHGKWSLVYYNEGVCDKACIKKLDAISRIKIATGKYSLRVQSVLLSDIQQTGETKTIIENIALLKYSTLALNTFKEKFLLNNTSMQEQAGWIYIIDPMGNLMMYYQADADPYDIIKDLKRLLKTSRIG